MPKESKSLLDLIMDDPDELLKPEVQIETTTFRLNKMPAMDGYYVLEDIRRAAADTLHDPLPLLGVAPEFVLLLSLLKFDKPFVESLRKKMFAEVKFSTSSTSLVALLNAEDEAFDPCEPSAVYEILFRSLAVNFTVSFRNLLGDLNSLQSSEAPGTK